MQYIVDTNGTVPFDEAPEAVRTALAFIKSRATAALKKPIDFNEILSAAYLEEQKMSVSYEALHWCCIDVWLSISTTVIANRAWGLLCPR